MNKLSASTKYARKVCVVIGVFGLLGLYLFNWNAHFIFTGQMYKSKVLEVKQEPNKCYQLTIGFTRINGELTQKTISDCTGETFLLWIEKGDTLRLWESKNHPEKYYIPFSHFAAKLTLGVFFVFIPFFFALFGRY